ncbi:MAG: 5'-nucleotidase C-terminal domain-containing protein [Spirochaetia bacterium]
MPGGVRIDIPVGELTVGEIYTLMPFGNTLTTMEMAGAQVKTVLEDALSNIFDDGNSSGSFPYVAGIRYYTVQSAPEGERVTAVETQTADGEWVELDDDAMLTVVTNAFIAAGRDGYDTFGAIDGYDTGFIDAEVFLDYVREVEEIGPVEPRVFFTAE